MRLGRWLIVILVGIVAGTFTGKLLWDDYQMDRAKAELPKVVALLDSIELPNRTSRTADDKTSVNEYAASVWRNYQTAISMAEFKTQFEDQLRALGFTRIEESRTYGGNLYCYRRAEYEFRLLIFNDPREEGDLALSANWYGG